MADRIYYCFCEANCKWETMTKEQIITAIEQAVSGGTIQDIDSGFISTIKEINHQQGLRFWVGTSAEFNSISERENNVLYIKTDDASADDIEAAISELRTDIEAIASSKLEVSVRSDGIYFETADGGYAERAIIPMLGLQAITGSYVFSGDNSDSGILSVDLGEPHSYNTTFGIKQFATIRNRINGEIVKAICTPWVHKKPTTAEHTFDLLTLNYEGVDDYKFSSSKTYEIDYLIIYKP